jgi:hypothetical protein
MAEEKAKPKKSERRKRVFKWLDRGLFAILLIAAVYFRVPWKVIVLLFGTTVISALVTKRIRRRIKWSAAAVLVVIVIWVFLPDNNEDWRPYILDKELTALEAKYAVPDEENATILYNQILENYDEDTFRGPNSPTWDIWDSTLTDFWSSQDQPEISAWLQNHQSTIETLLQATRMEKCRFPMAGDLKQLKANPPRNLKEVTDFWWSVPFRRPIQKLAWLLIRGANNDVAENRDNKALEKYTTALQMGRHLRQQSPTLENLAGISIEAKALDQIKTFLVTGNPTSNQLSDVRAKLAKLQDNWRSDFLKMLECEKLMLKSFMCAMAYQTNSRGTIRLNRDPNSTMRNLLHTSPESGLQFSKYWDKKLTKAETIFCWFFVPSTPQKAAKIIDKVCEKYYPMAQVDYDWQNDIPKFSWRSLRPNYHCFAYIISGIQQPNYSGIHDLYLRSLANRKACQVIIALKEYKNKNDHWPQTLEEIRSLVPSQVLIDPINGGSFVYKLTDDGFRLYSKGPNNIDEDGDFRNGDDWPLWPSRRQIREQEKLNDKQQNPDIGTKRKRRSRG